MLLHLFNGHIEIPFMLTKKLCNWSFESWLQILKHRKDFTSFHLIFSSDLIEGYPQHPKKRYRNLLAGSSIGTNIAPQNAPFFDLPWKALKWWRCSEKFWTWRPVVWAIAWCYYQVRWSSQSRVCKYNI